MPSSDLAAPAAPPGHPLIPAKPKNQTIHVSPAVLDAARKDGEELLQSLRTTAAGLTQAEAEERARTAGPNEVAQERRQGWFVRLLKIMRNPLVILLGTLSAVSFATGDARAGTVMAAMVVLSVTLRFVQEARADAAAAKLKAMIHVTATVLRDGAREGDAAARPGARGHHQAVRGRHDPGRRARAFFQRPLRQPGKPHRGVVPGREVPRPSDQGCQLTHRAEQHRASWGPASKAARPPQSWSPPGSTPISAAWPAPSRKSRRPPASIRASAASPGS